MLGLTSAAFDCTFKASYPEQYVVYKTDVPPKVDGKIGEQRPPLLQFAPRFALALNHCHFGLELSHLRPARKRRGAARVGVHL